MMIHLRDCIHLYLGCEASTYSGDGILESISSSGNWYVRLYSGGGAVGNINDTNRPCPEESRKTFPDGYPPASILFLILRPLSDMRDKEKREWREVANNKVEFAYENDALGMLYLIQKRFDLFGLIDKKVAIDKTKQEKP